MYTKLTCALVVIFFAAVLSTGSCHDFRRGAHSHSESRSGQGSSSSSSSSSSSGNGGSWSVSADMSCGQCWPCDNGPKAEKTCLVDGHCVGCMKFEENGCRLHCYGRGGK